MSVWKSKATKGGGDFEKAPAGNHPAVLVAMIDLGVQENEFNGVKNYQPRAYFCWELVNEKATNGHNHLIGIDLTVSGSEKSKLRQWLEAWRGKPYAEGEEFDLSKLIGQKCLLSVVEKNNYPKVAGVSAVPKGMKVDAPERTPIIWSVEDEGKIGLPDWLPYLYGEPLADVVKRRCEQVEETGPATATDATAAELETSIPF